MLAVDNFTAVNQNSTTFKFGPLTLTDSPQEDQPGHDNNSVPKFDNFPALVDSESILASHKQEGHDWIALSNPAQKSRTLGVELLYTFDHFDDISDVKFSPDGMYIASCCSHTVRIYDVQTGWEIKTLQISPYRSRFFRRVCFGPDGKSLVAGGFKMPGSVRSRSSDWNDSAD